MSTRYGPEVYDFVCEHVAGRTSAELAELVNREFGTNFTANKMKCYKNNHRLKSGTRKGIPKGRPTDLYPAEVREYIFSHYKGTSYVAMAGQLMEVFGRAYTPGQIMGFYKNHKLNSGLTGRFEKGHVPPNKGRKGFVAPGSEKGWFRSGHQPWDTAPLGAVVTKGDGYLWKKIDDKACNSRNNWRQLHLILWEEAHGPIPKGHLVIFKDGNKQNCVLENLAMISQSENAVMNKNGLRFTHPEHIETGILIAKIKIAAAKKKKNTGRKPDVSAKETQGAGVCPQRGGCMPAEE